MQAAASGNSTQTAIAIAEVRAEVNTAVRQSLSALRSKPVRLGPSAREYPGLDAGAFGPSRG
ncbi:hypothetical protein [Streptomyces sp. NPDC002078]